MCTFSLGLRGLTPVRAARFAVENFPNPVNVTSPPPLSVSTTASRNASTALPASRFDSCERRATSDTNSCFVTLSSSRRSLSGPERPDQLRVCGSTIRFCGGFLGLEQVSCPEKRPQTDGMARESVGSAFLPIDHTDCGTDYQSGLPDGCDRLEERPTGGDDVLDEADALARFERAFDAVRRPVVLGRVPDHEERQPRDERRGCGQDDAPEHGRGEPHRLRLVLADDGGDLLAERREEVGPGLEAVLVEVVARPLAGAEEEVPLEIRSGDERLP